jgi:hypothetical protein
VAHSLSFAMSLRNRGNRHNSAVDVREQPVYIYGLADPETGEVRYVGKSHTPRVRQVGLRIGGSDGVRGWLKSLQASGSKARLVHLKRVPPGENASEWEQHFITLFDALGARLLNHFGMTARYPGMN